MKVCFYFKLSYVFKIYLYYFKALNILWMKHNLQVKWVEDKHIYLKNKWNILNIFVNFSSLLRSLCWAESLLEIVIHFYAFQSVWVRKYLISSRTVNKPWWYSEIYLGWNFFSNHFLNRNLFKQEALEKYTIKSLARCFSG